jgi:hypothetical protein
MARKLPSMLHAPPFLPVPVHASVSNSEQNRVMHPHHDSSACSGLLLFPPYLISSFIATTRHQAPFLLLVLPSFTSTSPMILITIIILLLYRSQHSALSPSASSRTRLDSALSSCLSSQPLSRVRDNPPLGRGHVRILVAYRHPPALLSHHQLRCRHYWCRHR